MFSGRSKQRAEDTVGLHNWNRLAIHRRFPARIVDFINQDEAVPVLVASEGEAIGRHRKVGERKIHRSRIRWRHAHQPERKDVNAGGHFGRNRQAVQARLQIESAQLRGPRSGAIPRHGSRQREGTGALAALSVADFDVEYRRWSPGCQIAHQEQVTARLGWSRNVETNPIAFLPAPGRIHRKRLRAVRLDHRISDRGCCDVIRGERDRTNRRGELSGGSGKLPVLEQERAPSVEPIGAEQRERERLIRDRKGFGIEPGSRQKIPVAVDFPPSVVGVEIMKFFRLPQSKRLFHVGAGDHQVFRAEQIQQRRVEIVVGAAVGQRVAGSLAEAADVFVVTAQRDRVPPVDAGDAPNVRAIAAPGIFGDRRNAEAGIPVRPQEVDQPGIAGAAVVAHVLVGVLGRVREKLVPVVAAELQQYQPKDRHLQIAPVPLVFQDRVGYRRENGQKSQHEVPAMHAFAEPQRETYRRR